MKKETFLINLAEGLEDQGHKETLSFSYGIASIKMALETIIFLSGKAYIWRNKNSEKGFKSLVEDSYDLGLMY